jgi:putative acetyltransferase
MVEIRTDDLSGEPTRALIAYHLADMQGASPPGTSFALDLSGLTSPDVTLWTAWRENRLLGMGALKRLDPLSGEVKSMRTHPDHLRQGVAARLLDHIIAEARTRGLKRLSLETGTGETFEPALSLYRRWGFQAGEPFGGYTPSDFNQFFHLSL